MLFSFSTGSDIACGHLPLGAWLNCQLFAHQILKLINHAFDGHPRLVNQREICGVADVLIGHRGIDFEFSLRNKLGAFSPPEAGTTSSGKCDQRTGILINITLSKLLSELNKLGKRKQSVVPKGLQLQEKLLVVFF